MKDRPVPIFYYKNHYFFQFQITRLSRSAPTETQFVSQLYWKLATVSEALSPTAGLGRYDRAAPACREQRPQAKSAGRQMPGCLLWGEPESFTYGNTQDLIINHFGPSFIAHFGHYDFFKQVQAGYIICKLHFRMLCSYYFIFY